MPIVIGSGPSINDYPKEDIIDLCRYGFVFCVNSMAFEFPADIIVALDPQWIVVNAKLLKRINKPIVTRGYPAVKDLGLDLIYVPMDTLEKYPYSGMVAVKIADEISRQSEGRPSYILGIDGGKGNCKGYKGGGDYSKSRFTDLTKTISLAMKSKAYLPKLSKLPHPRKIVVTPEYRALTTAWIRHNAAKILEA